MQGWLSEMQKRCFCISGVADPKHRPRQYRIWSKIVK